MQNKILITNLSDISNTICIIPLLNVLKRNDYTVEVLTSEKGFELLYNNPSTDRVFLAPFEQWINKMPYGGIFEEIGDLHKKLNKRNYDIIIDCQRSFKSFIALMGVNAKRKLSYSDSKGFSNFIANEFIDSKPQYRIANLHTVEKNLNFARYLNLDCEKPEFMLPEQNYSKFNNFIKRNKNNKAIVLAPNQSSGVCAWSTKNWINLVSNIPDTYDIMVVGNRDDYLLANKFNHKNLNNLCAKTRLDDLRFILSTADIIISNNIETSLLAWAINKDNIITISTNDDITHFTPYVINESKCYVHLSGKLTCQPCNTHNCKDKTYKCINYPTVETILKYIN